MRKADLDLDKEQVEEFLMSLMEDEDVTPTADDPDYASAPEKNVAQDSTETEEEPANRVIAKADEFKVEVDADEQVHLLDGENSVRVSMPLMIWKQLARGM